MCENKPTNFSIKLHINRNSLIEFYKDDNNPCWGDYKNPCIADSFSELVVLKDSIEIPTRDIIYLEHNSTNCIKILSYDNLKDELINNIDDSILIIEMVKRENQFHQPNAADWAKIFSLPQKEDMIINEDGKLLITENSSGNIEINNQTKFRISTILRYSIKFKFKDTEGKCRYGIIDPFISVRSDDPE